MDRDQLIILVAAQLVDGPLNYARVSYALKDAEKFVAKAEKKLGEKKKDDLYLR